MSSPHNFLAPNQCLVYIDNPHPFADTDGVVHIATIRRSFMSDDTLWFDVLLQTDLHGEALSVPRPCTISGDNIVSNREYHDIQPRQMYHFAQGPDTVITANSFVITKNLNNPLESTSRSALGSGIYGRYIQHPTDIPSLIFDPKQPVYLIDLTNAYIVQDKEHSETITIASLNTNRYIDRVITSLIDSPEIDPEVVHTEIRDTIPAFLPTLWNIALYRTNTRITQEWLIDTLTDYTVMYLTDTSLIDTINGESIQQLPINSIMRKLGYTGLLGSDAGSNGWDRGCVSYLYDQATILQGNTATY